ncbi:MAG: class I SAM-dependent methyltransferase [Myxococcota bacterium]
MTTLAAPFWDQIAEKYAAKPIDDVPAYEAKLARLRDLLQSDDRVLELGCGTGGTARALAPSVREVVATDISEAMLEIAHRRLRETDLENITFLQRNATDVVPGAPFDVVCAFSLLHLVPDLPATLGAVHDNLAPGGTFISKTVCLGDRSPFLRGMVHVMKWMGRAPYVNMLSRDQLLDAIGNAGFELVEASHFGTHASSPFVVARRPA